MRLLLSAVVAVDVGLAVMLGFKVDDPSFGPPGWVLVPAIVVLSIAGVYLARTRPKA